MKLLGHEFGTSQVGKPTPRNISLILDFSAGFFGIAAAWLTTASYIPHGVSDALSSIFTGLIIPILLLGKKFFGTDVTTKSVPTSQVTEIKEPESK